MKIYDTRNETINLTKLFIENLKEETYILGTNKYGSAMATWLSNRGISVAGFINDYTDMVLFENYPVIKSSTDFQNDAIINCIVEGRSIDARKNIEKCNPAKTSDYFKLQLAFKDELPSVDFLVETESILENIESYEKLYSQLEDEVSREHFENITNFRLNRDIDYLSDFKFNLRGQYFENFILLNSNASFIDGGGFDGGTSKLFAETYPDFEAIYYFEPTENSFNNSVENLKGVDKIRFYKKGLWDKTETLVFDNTLGSANKISNKGNVTIETVSIDDVIETGVDYVKMDIEGAEYKALHGAQNLVKNHKPKLAICVYHNQIDFIRLPELILSYRSDYKIYLRHYTQGVFETVMYFV